MRVYRYLSGDPCIVARFQERQISVSYSPLFVSHSNGSGLTGRTR
jgi:hypothetical protein